MRVANIRLDYVVFVALALSVLALTLGCFGGEEPEPTPEPTAPPEPTATATATAMPELTPPPPVPVMPPLPPGRQTNQPVGAQPVPTISVRLIPVEQSTAAAGAQLNSETPVPAVTSTPEAAPDVQPAETPVPEPTATPTPEIPNTPTPIPIPTATPTPAIAAESALAVLTRALTKLADSPGHRQDMTFTYRITVPGDEAPRHRKVQVSFDYVKPDLMEGTIQIDGLTEGQEFTSIANAIYTPAREGFHVPMTMPMRIGPSDVLACNILECASPDMARAPRIIQLTLDNDDTTPIYEIAAAHGQLGYPHAANDPRLPVDVTYMVSAREENVRYVRFANVELDRAHFSGFVEALIGLGIDEIESISMDMDLELTKLDPGRHIATPLVRPTSENRPEIVTVDFRAGQAQQDPGPGNCNPNSCGSALIQFSRPVITWGPLTLVVDGKGALECVEGCSREYASSYMLFTGDAWVEPGDEIISSRISKSDVTVIADERGTEILTYSFDPHLRALSADGETVEPSSAVLHEPQFTFVNRYPEEDVIYVRGFALDPNIVYSLRFNESLGFDPGCPESLRDFSMRKGDSVGNSKWDDPAQDAATELRGYFGTCRTPQSAGLLLLSVFDEVSVLSERVMAGGSESIRIRREGKPGITNIDIQGYELNTGYEYEYELEHPADAPATCTDSVRRKRLYTDNQTYTEFPEYLGLCLGVDVYFGEIRTVLWKRFGSADWEVVATGWLTPDGVVRSRDG